LVAQNNHLHHASIPEDSGMKAELHNRTTPAFAIKDGVCARASKHCFLQPVHEGLLPTGVQLYGSHGGAQTACIH
jgi:hypothetical protein